MTLHRTYDGVTGDLLEEYETPDPVPEVVSARQIKLALLQFGMLDSIETFVGTQDRPVQISWEYATEFRRDDPMIVALGPVAGISDEQIDGLFGLAAGL